MIIRPSSIHRRNCKTQQSPVIMNLCIRRSRLVKSRDHPDVIVFEELRFQNVFSRPYENEKPAFSNSFGLKSVFEKLVQVTILLLVFTTTLTLTQKNYVLVLGLILVIISRLSSRYKRQRVHYRTQNMKNK